MAEELKHWTVYPEHPNELTLNGGQDGELITLIKVLEQIYITDIDGRYTKRTTEEAIEALEEAIEWLKK